MLEKRLVPNLLTVTSPIRAILKRSETVHRGQYHQNGERSKHAEQRKLPWTESMPHAGTRSASGFPHGEHKFWTPANYLVCLHYHLGGVYTTRVMQCKRYLYYETEDTGRFALPAHAGFVLNALTCKVRMQGNSLDSLWLLRVYSPSQNLSITCFLALLALLAT